MNNAPPGTIAILNQNDAVADQSRPPKNTNLNGDDVYPRQDSPGPGMSHHPSPFPNHPMLFNRRWTQTSNFWYERFSVIAATATDLPRLGCVNAGNRMMQTHCQMTTSFQPLPGQPQKLMYSRPATLENVTLPKSKRQRTKEQHTERDKLKNQMGDAPSPELYALFVQNTQMYKSQLAGKSHACVDVLRSRKLSCECVHALVTSTAHRARNNQQNGTIQKLSMLYSAFRKLNLRLGRDQDVEHEANNMAKCFSIFSRHVQQVVGEGSGKRVFFELNQQLGIPSDGLRFCSKSLQNLMGFEEESWFATCLETFDQEEMFGNAVLYGLCKLYCINPSLLKEVETSVNQPEQLYSAFRDIVGNRVPPTPFFRKSITAYDFIVRDDVFIVSSEGRETGKSIHGLPGTPAYIEYDPNYASIDCALITHDQLPKRNPRQNDNNDDEELPLLNVRQLLVHEDNATVFRVRSDISEKMQWMRDELMAGKGFTRSIDTVMGLRPLKYRSTIHAEKGWLTFFRDILKVKNNNSAWKMSQELDEWFRGLVNIMIGPEFFVKYDVGFMRTELSTKSMKDLAQTLHFDMKKELILDLYSRDQKMFVAFMAIEIEGMWLMVCKCYDGRPDQTMMWHIPQGEILFVPVTLLHAGGFRTSCTGNLRFHFYVYCSRSERDIIGRVSLGNDYIALEKSSSGKSCTYKKSRSAWNQGAVKFFHENFQNGRRTEDEQY